MKMLNKIELTVLFGLIVLLFTFILDIKTSKKPLKTILLENWKILSYSLSCSALIIFLACLIIIDIYGAVILKEPSMFIRYIEIIFILFALIFNFKELFRGKTNEKT
mgnify:CR=1 FL=1